MLGVGMGVGPCGVCLLCACPCVDACVLPCALPSFENCALTNVVMSDNGVHWARVLCVPAMHCVCLQFAKNIPKPEIRQSPSPGEPGARGRAPAGKAGSAGSSSSANKAAAKKSGGKGAGGSENSQLAALEAQHAADQRRVDQIRAELARML